MDIKEDELLSKRTKSYWIDSISSKEYPTLKENIMVDVAIIGAGIAGISAAYLLSKQGIKVVVLESDRILQGTTGHTTAKITSQHGLIYSNIKSQMGVELAKQYAEANEAAIHMIEKIILENEIECDFMPESAYVYTQQDRYIDKIEDEAYVAASLHINANSLAEIPIGFPIKAAVRFQNQAQFHPRKFLIPLAEKFVALGGQIFEKTRVIQIEDDHRTLVTNTGNKVVADKIIIASHYPCFNKPGFYFTRIYSEKSYVVAVKASEPYVGGMYITAEDPGRSLRSQKTDTGELVLVGGEHHKTGQGIDTSLHFQALENFARENFKVEQIPYHWSTQDCMTLDQIPYVGQFTPKTPNLFVATGYGKWGMTNSIASAMLLRDLIIEGNSPWQDVYSPSRGASAASISTFATQNANVAKELIGGKIAPLPSEVELKRGEGRVIEHEGQRAGAYRDHQGELHIVDTTCTHMGCELQWNSAEVSWDCPCHGSRFSYDGEILEGPAVSPLAFHKDVNTIVKLLTENF